MNTQPTDARGRPSGRHPSAEFAGLRCRDGGADLPEATRGSKYHKDQADGQLGGLSEQLSLPASRLHPPPAM